MDDISVYLIERDTPLPYDIVRYINSFAVREELNDNNFYQARDLWFNDKNLCMFRFGHISDWNTSHVTDMRGTFYKREEISTKTSANGMSVTSQTWVLCFLKHRSLIVI